jgi:hypothetical protein
MGCESCNNRWGEQQHNPVDLEGSCFLCYRPVLYYPNCSVLVKKNLFDNDRLPDLTVSALLILILFLSGPGGEGLAT